MENILLFRDKVQIDSCTFYLQRTRTVPRFFISFCLNHLFYSLCTDDLVVTGLNIVIFIIKHFLVCSYFLTRCRPGACCIACTLISCDVWNLFCSTCLTCTNQNQWVRLPALNNDLNCDIADNAWILSFTMRSISDGLDRAKRSSDLGMRRWWNSR